MFSKFMEQPCNTIKVIAATAPAQNMPNTNKKLDDLSAQIKQIQKQQQRQQQQMQASYAMAAYDQPPATSHSSQPRNWQGGLNIQVDQLQRQVTRLKNELRWYQNLCQPDFRAFGRSYRSTEGDPICTTVIRSVVLGGYTSNALGIPDFPQTINLHLLGGPQLVPLPPS